MMNAGHPRGRWKPPSSSSARACREKPHAGGYRRMVSSITMRVYGRFMRSVYSGGRPLSTVSISLLESPLRTRVLRQQIPRPRQCQRRRLLTRQQKRRDLNPQLLVCHGLAGLLVARRQQHGKQVGAVRRVAPALADHVIDRSLEHSTGRLEPSVFGGWQPVGEPERPEALADILVEDGPVMVDLGRIISSATSTGRPSDAIVCHCAAASLAASAITPASAAMRWR
jgi:hypothetical protein